MASGVAGGTLRTLRDLFSRGTAVGVDDGQLLARYADARDETAFEALVTRHGPMVLATCRAVLGHEQDVEDAFQATFFVLARKARSVRAGDALGGWLHRVAYRAAVQASVASRRRRLTEMEAAMSSLRAAPAETEVPGIVHEELDRLPERQRLPLILCDLEDLTYEQAARHLGWTEPTLRHRLVSARQRLRERLCRRGLNAGAVGGLVGSKLEVSAALARLAIAGAVGGEGSAFAFALANTLIRIMLMTRLKLAAVGLAFAIITAATSGVVAVGDQRVVGDVVVKGGPRRDTKAAALAPIPDGKAQAKPRLSAEAGPGVEGRIVDLEGRPVSGARIELIQLLSAPNNDLGKWLDRVQEVGVSYPMQGLYPGNLPAVSAGRVSTGGASPKGVTTDQDGRFRLVGIGSEQVAEIRVSGPTIATAQVYATGRDGAEIRANVRQGVTPSHVIYHARRFEYVVTPAKPIQGIVRDEDTGRPLAGITLRAALYDQQSLIPAPGIVASTDERGSYRLLGLPKAPAYRLFVEPDPGMPYPGAALRVAVDTPTFEPLNHDVALKRGGIVRGTVTEKETGRPLEASVDIYSFADNPHVREYPGYRAGNLARFFTFNGRYEGVAIQGRGVIGIIIGGYAPPYRTGVGADAIKGFDARSKTFQTEPGICQVENYHALAEFNLDPKVEAATVDLQVERGRTIVVKPVDPDGRPIAGTMVAGINDRLASLEAPQEKASIMIVGFDPSHPRRVTVRHEGRGLVGSLYLKGDEANPLTLRLQPWGTITGRLVDDEGRPRGGLSVSSLGGMTLERPAEQGLLPGGVIGDGILVGRDGRFRIEGLVPGLKYGAGTGEGFKYFVELFRDLTVAPGEVKDLGDLKDIPPNGPTK